MQGIIPLWPLTWDFVPTYDVFWWQAYIRQEGGGGNVAIQSILTLVWMLIHFFCCLCLAKAMWELLLNGDKGLKIKI
jgi:hypothetical protein